MTEEIKDQVFAILVRASCLIGYYEVSGIVDCPGCNKEVTAGHTMLSVLTLDKQWRTLLCNSCALVFLDMYQAHILLHQKSFEAWKEIDA
jgi:hypothetical protein